jgi:hypothetical protein
MGDQYVFIAMDAETKLVPSFIVGKRSAANAYLLMRDLSNRLATRVQLTTDGFRPYVAAVDDTFGTAVKHAMLVKTYGDAEPKRAPLQPGTDCASDSDTSHGAPPSLGAFRHHTSSGKILPCGCGDLLG